MGTSFGPVRNLPARRSLSRANERREAERRQAAPQQRQRARQHPQEAGPLLGLFRRRWEARHRPRRRSIGSMPSPCRRPTPTPGSARTTNGHLQATGMDARGRKQYRYHPAFRARRDKKKYNGLLEFGAALPKIRRQGRRGPQEAVSSAAKPCWPQSSACSTPSYLRVGNEQYATRQQELRRDDPATRHLKRTGSKLMMRFIGKHGIVHEVTITRQQPEAHRQEVPGAARPDAVPISRRRWRAARGHLGRRQRLHPRGERRRIHRQEFPHLGRERDRLRRKC